MKKLKIGNVELENRYLLGPMAGDRPAFSFAVQGTGSGSFRDGNG